MKKTNRKQKGITLIALIITIIVMLILVGVSVNIALNNGLFKATQNAATDTKEAVTQENKLATGQITIDGKTFSSIESYVAGNVGVPAGVKIGDYISNYDPTPVYNNGTNYKVAKSLTGRHTSDQTFIEDETLGWRVLSIDEATGKVELIADKATSTKLHLEGAVGWNNSINVLNDTCKAIYSKAGVGEARSINVEDVNKISGYDPTTYEGYGNTYQASHYGSYNYFPAEYLKEKGMLESTVSGGAARNSTISVEYTYYSYKPEEQTGYTAPAGLINTGVEYWLASRCVKAESSCVHFDIFRLRSSGSVSTCGAYNTYGNEVSDVSTALRPVVTLTSNAKLEKDETATTADKTYWKIK